MTTLTPWKYYGYRLALGALVALSGLSVYLLNGAPLYYFDTAGYLHQGGAMLNALGFPAPTGSDVAAPGGAAQVSQDTVVIASRSAIYGLITASLARLGALDFTVALQLGLIWLATFLAAHRLVAPAVKGAFEVAMLGMVAGSLTALPFYVALLLPDILAPVLILMLAFLCTQAPGAGWRGFLPATVLALLAIFSHPSHLLMAVLILPMGLFLSPAMAGRRLWLSLSLAALLVGFGIAERLTFGFLAERVQQKQALYLPFLTARLIDDGPGLTYLAARCPDARIATCNLYDRLVDASDPARFDAPNILFAEQPELGSYKRLSEAEQKAVAAEQIAFFLDVVQSAPLASLTALARNVATQLVYNRIDMTVPPSGQSDTLRAQFGNTVASLRDGRLVEANRRWMAPLAGLHTAIYLISALTLAVFLIRGRMSRGNAAFTVLVLWGILMNALVCGGVSEPAYRYGARVMVLLPMMAIMLWAAARRPA